MFDLLFIEKTRTSLVDSSYKKTLLLNLYTDWLDEASKQVQVSEQMSENFIKFSFVEIRKYLINITEQVLFIEYNVFIEERNITSNQGLYLFEYQLLTVEYRKYLLDEYPELFDLAYKAIKYFIVNINEIIFRLNEDYFEIENDFCVDLSSKIEYIKLGLGDRHNNHKSVSLIKYENNCKIIYKPRNLGIDKVLYNFFSYYNDIYKTNLYVPKTLYRGKYGWAEFIEKQEVSLTDIHDYFCNFGHLLSILYIMNGSDIHYENILTSYNNKITLLDCETIFSPIKTDDQFNYLNVLSVGLLPNKIKIDGKYNDFGGINSLFDKNSDSPFQQENISANNIGVLNIENNTKTVNIYSNINIGNYINDICDGFQKSYTHFLNNKQEIITIFSKIPKSTCVRYLTRHTFSYSHILSQSLNPIFLNNKEKRKSFLKQLNLSFEENPSHMVTYQSDFLDLYNDDIPYYFCNFFLKTIENKDLKVGYFDYSPFESLLKKIDNLTLSDLTKQCWLIKYSFLEESSKTFEVVQNDKIKINIRSIHNFFSDVISNCDFYYTVNHSYDENNKYKIELNNPDLIFGTLGDLLFLKESNVYLYDENINKIIRRIYNKNILTIIKNPPRNIGFGGIAGIIYFLIRMFQINKEEHYLQDLKKFILTSKISNLFSHCNNFGLLSGKSGLLLSLLHTYKIMDNDYSDRDELRILIDKIYKDILANVIHSSSNEIYWKSEYHKKPLCGMAHGISGIVTALLEYYSIFKDPDTKVIIQKAINYENSFFNKSKLNWRDNRNFIKSEKDAYSSFGWSHGSPGIGLCRLKILESEMFKDDSFESIITEDLNNCVKSTILNGFNGNSDSLIFGKYGCAELIMKYSKYHNDPRIINELRSRLNVNVEQLNYLENNIGLLIPGLFNGISGFGYQILYLNNIIKKSILTFEI